MYKITPVWEEERFEQQRDEAFAEAIDQILSEEDDEDPMEVDGEQMEEDEEEEEEAESEWETDSEAESSECECAYCQNDMEEEYEGWSFDSTDTRLSEIADIQDQFNRFSRIGLDPSVFVQAYAEGAIFVTDKEFWEDFPNTKYLFVSKHSLKPVGSRRVGYRLRPMGICV